MEIGSEQAESVLSRFGKNEQETVLQIEKMIKENRSDSNVEIRFTTGKSKPTITNLLAKMCDERVLVSAGTGRSTHDRKSTQLK